VSAKIISKFVRRGHGHGRLWSSLDSLPVNSTPKEWSDLPRLTPHNKARPLACTAAVTALLLACLLARLPSSPPTTTVFTTPRKAAWPRPLVLLCRHWAVADDDVLPNSAPWLPSELHALKLVVAITVADGYVFPNLVRAAGPSVPFSVVDNDILQKTVLCSQVIASVCQRCYYRHCRGPCDHLIFPSILKDCSGYLSARCCSSSTRGSPCIIWKGTGVT
jgi:hypothetical protein